MSETEAFKNLCFADSVFADRYEGWQEIGDGGHATVVKTRGRHDGAILALKVFRHLPGDHLPRLQREVNAARELASPYIVKTYSLFARGSLCWFEMEYVDGTDMEHELLRRQKLGEPFTYSQALDIAIAIAAGVDQAHQAGIIHRDLKPANILLPRGRAPAAKLSDFGIARMREGVSLTKTDQLVGTPMFTSPEAIEGAPLTSAHDVYCLGLCLFLLFTNNRFPLPVQEDTTTKAMLQLHSAKEEAERLHSFCPELPDDLDQLIARCLTKKPPAERPSAPEILQALLALAQSLPRAAPDVVRHVLSQTPPTFQTTPGAPSSEPPDIPAALPAVEAGHARAASTRQILGAVALGTLVLVISLAIRAANAPATASSSSMPTPASTTTAAAPLTPPATPATAAPVKATVRGGFLRLVTSDVLQNPQFVLVGASGLEYKHALVGALSPDEGAFYSLDSFSPVPGDGETFRELRVSARGPAGERSFTVSF